MELVLVLVIPVVLIAAAAALRWGRAEPSSAKQRELARRNYMRDLEDQ